MIKKLLILIKIGRALAKSSTLDYFEQLYKPNIFIRSCIKIFGFSSFRKKSLDSKSVGLRLVKALEELGPTFIKLGQFLGTRPDIVGKDLAIELQSLQDDLPPFAMSIAKQSIIDEIGQEKFNEIKNSAWDADVNPAYVEVNFSNVCNLACTYCSPQFSSTWAAQTERYGAYPTTVPHNAPEHFAGKIIPNRESNPYVEAFWKWWPDLYPELKHFRMTGGEPIMDKNTYRVFDYILDNPNPNLHINTTSNFSVEPALFEKYLDYAKRLCIGETVEHFMQFVSVDTWGSQAEYIRPGLDFERLQNNVERFLTEIPGRNSVTFIITMNNLVVPGIQRLLEWILELRAKHSTSYQRVWFDTPLLRQPQWQSLQIMPESYAWNLEQVLHWMEKHVIVDDMHDFVGFKDFEINKMRRDIAWMRTKHPNLNIQRNMIDFYRFFIEHDHRHKTVFMDIFPEMSDWWAECKYYAKKEI